MEDEGHKDSCNILAKLLATLPRPPGLELLRELWKVSCRLVLNLSLRGMYEVLEYESTLELMDSRGKRATFAKKEKVCYLQDNTIAYQD